WGNVPAHHESSGDANDRARGGRTDFCEPSNFDDVASCGRRHNLSAIPDTLIANEHVFALNPHARVSVDEARLLRAERLRSGERSPLQGAGSSIVHAGEDEQHDSGVVNME